MTTWNCTLPEGQGGWHVCILSTRVIEGRNLTPGIKRVVETQRGKCPHSGEELVGFKVLAPEKWAGLAVYLPVGTWEIASTHWWEDITQELNHANDEKHDLVLDQQWEDDGGSAARE